MSEKNNSKISTGDFVYQINNISKRIKTLQYHLEKYKKDFNSKSVLYKLVATRKKQIKYLEQHDFKKYQEFVSTTELRISKNKNKKR